MFIGASAYDFLVAKTNLSQTQSLVSYVQVLGTHRAKTSAEQKQCCNVAVLLMKLSTRAKRSTLYASGCMVM